MKKTSKKILIIMALVALAVLWLPHPAQAAFPDRLIIGGNFTLEDGETLNEDLLVVGGLVTLENGSTLNGDILMVGGSLEAAGEINGDISVAGGLLEIGETAVINGDVNSAGANLQRDPDAIITGEITTEQNGPFIVTPTGVEIPRLNMAVDPSFSFIGFMLRVILWALLAMLLALFLPNQLRNLAQTAVSQPLITGGLGLLTAVVLPLVLVILALTILLIPVSLVGILALVIAWAYGLIALGTELGNRFAGIFKAQWHPALAAGAGTFLLILVINGLEAAIPCVGLVPKFIVGVVGLGAVLLTRGGMQPYPPKAVVVLSEPAIPVE
jgi:hypothetical protein